MTKMHISIHLRILKQVVMVWGICLGAVNMGMITVWPNVALTDLRRDNSTLYGNSITLSDTQKDMVGSLLPIGGIVGTLAGGKLVDRIGRRLSMMWVTVPCLVGWIMLALSFSPAMILTARFINGVYYGIVLVAGSTYVVELPDTNMRGAMAAFPTIFLQLGYILVLVSGLGLRWFQIPFVGVAISIVGLVAMWFIPESPKYLIAIGQEDKARMILSSLRGVHADIEAEINDLQVKNKDVHQESFLKFFKMPDIRKSFVILLVLFFINNFCGMSILVVNMTRIFRDSGTQLHETTSTLIVFLSLLVGASVSVFYLDYIGRRNSMIISLSILTICLVTFGTYVHAIDSEKAATSEEIKAIISTISIKEVETGSDFIKLHHPPIKITYETHNSVNKDERYVYEFESKNETMITTSWASQHKWLSVACLLVFMVGASMGVTQVPFILNSEYFPTSIRPQASSICILVDRLFNALALQLFTPMQAVLTPAGFYWFTAGICIFGVIFSYYFIVETKGKAIG